MNIGVHLIYYHYMIIQSMNEKTDIWLRDAEMTRFAGASLVHTLYGLPVTLWITGELGAGKTTLLQGLAQELGIEQRLTSPTFALEQRYQTTDHGELLHVDLYRLGQSQASLIALSSDEHTGIRCIEWAERLPSAARTTGIFISMEEESQKTGRKLTIEFHDLHVPTQEQIAQWRNEFFLPHMIVRHCETVADTAVRLGSVLLENGQIVRLQALRAAAAVHDLLRFVDFHRGASHIEQQINPTHAQKWSEIKARYAGLRHESAVAQFLIEQGFAQLAEIVRVHGLTLSNSKRVTTEQRLLYYADKRVKLDEVVSLEERLRDFTVRYSHLGKLTESNAWYEEALKTEKELFPNGPPF